MCLWADSEALKQYMIQPYIFAFERLSSSLSSCCARANSVNHRMRRVRRVAQLFWFNSNTYRRLKFTGQNSETNELVNIGVVALDMNKYTFTEGLACNGFMKACSEGIGAAIGVCIQNVNMQPKHKHFCPWQDTALVNILQKRDLIMNGLKKTWNCGLFSAANQPCLCEVMRRSLIALCFNIDC